MPEQILDDVERAFHAKAYWVGLTLALTIPDICGRAFYGNLKINERYIKWYDEYNCFRRNAVSLDSPYSLLAYCLPDVPGDESDCVAPFQGLFIRRSDRNLAADCSAEFSYGARMADFLRGTARKAGVPFDLPKKSKGSGCTGCRRYHRIRSGIEIWKKAVDGDVRRLLFVLGFLTNLIRVNV